MTKKAEPAGVTKYETDDGWVEYENLVRTETFTDDAGIRWRRRGSDVLSGRDLLKLLLDPAVTVLHEYLDERTVIAPEQRAAFWQSAERAMRESKFSDFYGGEFKNDARQRLLVVHEDC